MRINNRLVNSLALFILLHSYVFAQVDHIGSAVKVPDHPRILMLKGEEDSIKKTIATDTTWDKLQQAILTECDNLLATAPVERIQIGRRLLDKSREALRRLFLLSCAYRLIKEQKCFQRAEKE